jgi:phosphatidylserine/phosphatidylglycerophosphate/cardiolipin synthase-like enzyme
VELVESSPIETALDHPDIPDAKDVWIEMISKATSTLEFAEFYASNSPGSRLEPVVRAVEAAADRGVKVRFLSEEKFYQTYPETLDRLKARRGIQVRLLKTGSLMGGVLHAKYFMADGREAFIGSQNFDWRSLEHIQELGVRLRVPSVLRALADVFETDWALAGGAGRDTRIHRAMGDRFPDSVTLDGEPLRITPGFSPKGWLPDETLWDLPRLVALIDSAQKSVRVQLLSYRAVDREGRVFGDLEQAFRRAASRGATVQLVVADWSKRDERLEQLRRLHSPPAISVKIMSIPEWSGGSIPFARVVHAKYLVVDGQRSWIGTSNWERDYFFHSRNVGVILEHEGLAKRLDRFFLDNWGSRYAAFVQ